MNTLYEFTAASVHVLKSSWFANQGRCSGGVRWCTRNECCCSDGSTENDLSVCNSPEKMKK